MAYKFVSWNPQHQQQNLTYNPHVIQTVSGNWEKKMKNYAIHLYGSLIPNPEILTHFYKGNGRKMLSAIWFEIATVHKVEM